MNFRMLWASYDRDRREEDERFNAPTKEATA
jgi:hypothetical protein